MLCDSCGTECPTSMQRSEGDLDLLYHRCDVCDVHQITFKHGSKKDSLPRVLRTIEYIREALEGSWWKVDSVKQTPPMGDDICP